MKILITISLLLVSAMAAAQTDCRNIDDLLQKLWKYEAGSTSWKRVNDSLLAICPNSAKLWVGKGQAYLLAGEFVEGMQYLNKAAKLDPHSMLGSRAWYKVYYLHDYDGAIKDMDTLEQISGRTFVYVINMHMYILKGIAYDQLKNSEKALQCFNLAIDEQVKEKGDNWVGTYDYLLRGIHYYKSEHYDDAIKDLTRQVKEYEALADTYYYRGLAYAATGRRDEARVDLEHARELMLGKGEKRWEGAFVYPNEVFLSNIDAALRKLY